MADEKSPTWAGPPGAAKPGDESKQGESPPSGPIAEGQIKQQDAQGKFIADERVLAKTGNKAHTDPPGAQPVVPGDEPKAPGKEGGPAIHTGSKTNFAKQKIAELERQAIEAEDLQGTRRVQRVAAIRAQVRELRERESRTIGGADIRMPRGSILHAEEAIAKRPDFHYRFVNVNAPGKADNAKAIGYEKVPEEDGGKTLGELVLFRIPLERHSQVVGARDVETKARLKRVTEDLKGEVKSMAKYLQSRGVDVDPERLGVFSENPED